MALSPPLDLQLNDDTANRLKVSQNEAIKELQKLPAATLRYIAKDLAIAATGAGIFLEIPVFHSLGRPPKFVWFSPVRVEPGNYATLTNGMLLDLGLRTTPFGSNVDVDRSKQIVIGAFGFTVPVTVDIAVA